MLETLLLLLILGVPAWMLVVGPVVEFVRGEVENRRWRREREDRKP